MLKEFLQKEYKIGLNDKLILFFSKEQLTVKTFLQLIENTEKEQKVIQDIIVWKLKDPFSVLAYMGGIAQRMRLEKVS